MREIHLTFGRRGPTEIIGVTGENLATVLLVDVSGVLEDAPDAVFSLVVRTPMGCLYPATVMLPYDASGLIRYVLTDLETAAAGTLYVEVQARQDEALLKSWTQKFKIERGLTPPDCREPVPDWVDDVTRDAQRADDAADRSEAARDQAVEAAKSASDNAVSTAADREVVARLAGEVQENKDATDENVEISTELRDETKEYAELAEANFQLFDLYVDDENYLHIVIFSDEAMIDMRIDDEMILHWSINLGV